MSGRDDPALAPLRTAAGSMLSVLLALCAVMVPLTGLAIHSPYLIPATLIGAGTGYVCGFDPVPSLFFALAITQMGFFGGLVMSAIKRDAGVKDWGHLIPGHGGAMDRVDSLAFAAPVFFHLVRFFYSET